MERFTQLRVQASHLTGAVWAKIRLLLDVLGLIRFSLGLPLFVLAILLTDQGEESLRALGQSTTIGESIAFCVAVIGLATSAWYTSRIMFLFRFGTDASKPTAYPLLKKLLPRGLGVFILVALALKVLSVQDGAPAESGLVAIAIGLIVSAVVFLWFVINRRSLFGVDDFETQLTREVKSWRDLDRSTQFVFAGLLTVNFLMVLAAAYGAEYLAAFLGLAGLVPLWAATVTASGSILVYAANHYRVPAISIALGLAIVFSFFNDNHSVRQFPGMRPYHSQDLGRQQPARALEELSVVTEDEAKPGNDPLTKYFENWVQDLLAARPDGIVPVFLVSAEGGGIRAAYWTAAVLAELEDRSQRLGEANRDGGQRFDFARHVFSISGVSGGSLGAATFAAAVRHNRDASGPKQKVRDLAAGMLKEDFLAPTVAVMLFPDLLQRFLPFPFLDDRALALERSWEAAWKASSSGSEDFAQPMEDLWRPADFQVPLLFLNSAAVETGQRVIMQPLVFKSPAETRLVFNDALDGVSLLGGEVPLSTAVHMSARFTYVSPAGLIEPRDGAQVSGGIHEPRDWLRVVDGGYFENSGTVTSAEILQTIRRMKNPRIRPIVLHISNEPMKTARGDDACGHDRYPGMGEVTSPIWALLNVRPARGFQARKYLRRAVGPHWHFHFRLCESSVKLPLGWMLGDGVRKAIDDQLPRLDPLTGMPLDDASGAATANLKGAAWVEKLLTEKVEQFDGSGARAWNCGSGAYQSPK